jgi:hypothetical protein
MNVQRLVGRDRISPRNTIRHITYSPSPAKECACVVQQPASHLSKELQRRHKVPTLRSSSNSKQLQPQRRAAEEEEDASAGEVGEGRETAAERKRSGDGSKTVGVAGSKPRRNCRRPRKDGGGDHARISLGGRNARGSRQLWWLLLAAAAAGEVLVARGERTRRLRHQQPVIVAAAAARRFDVDESYEYSLE